jgi:primosomal protein N' (replication factor Y)
LTVAHHGARAPDLGAAGVERRVEIGHLDAAGRLGAQERQVVTEQDPVHGPARLPGLAAPFQPDAGAHGALLGDGGEDATGSASTVRRPDDRPRRAAHHHAPPRRPVRLRAAGEPVGSGSIVRVPFGRQALDGVVVALAETSELAPERLVGADVRAGDSVPDELVDLALWIAREYCSTPARALGSCSRRAGARGPSCTRAAPARRSTAAPHRRPARAARAAARSARPDLRRCAGSSAAAWSRSRAERRRAPRTTPARPCGRAHAEQERPSAVERGGAHLLHGVTGSGKTEVYLRAGRAALERGEGVIVLVPEIALTPQTVARFQARFGDTVALLHSRSARASATTSGAACAAARRAIAVGPRSAVFAPVADLGLSCRRGARRLLQARGRPALRRPHGRDERARRAGARCWSAAPRRGPETWHALPRLRCPSGSTRGPLPPVRVLDMRGARHALHPETRRALAPRASRSCCSTGAAGRTSSPAARAGRRGSARLRRRARAAPRRARVACHHCGHRERVPERCDACGSLSVARHGAGTERLEHELREALDVPVFRLDADTAAQGRRPGAARALRAAPAGCCSARRWSPRATTSPT